MTEIDTRSEIVEWLAFDLDSIDSDLSADAAATLLALAAERDRLVAEVAAREQAARREVMEEAAQLVDCGCAIRDAVLERLESQGEKRASYLCPRGDVCCALQAASLRAAVKEGP